MNDHPYYPPGFLGHALLEAAIAAEKQDRNAILETLRRLDEIICTRATRFELAKITPRDASRLVEGLVVFIADHVARPTTTQEENCHADAYDR